MGFNVAEKTVCLTGKVPGLSREQAAAKLREAGAHTVGTVTRNTHLLIVGADVGPVKVEKAEKLGVTVVPWQDVAFDGKGDDAPVSAAAPPPKKLAFVQVAPMLAVSGQIADTMSGDWVYEIKWDGNRAVAHIHGDAVGIQSRSAKSDYTPRYPQVAGALADWAARRPDLGSVIVDGELVILDGEDSGGSFQMLAAHENSGSAKYIVFDVIECNGKNLRQMTFAQRRELLEAMDLEGDHVALSPVWDDGEKLLELAQEKGLEGIMAKPLSSTYRDGHRGPWMKLKVRLSQEFIVVGYTPASGQFTGGVGSLLLAVIENEKITLCGECGTGFSRDQRFAFKDMLDKIETPAVADDIAMTDKERRALAREGAVWCWPQNVANVEFQRWTEDDRLFHPSFQGFRDDKLPTEVVRET